MKRAQFSILAVSGLLVCSSAHGGPFGLRRAKPAQPAVAQNAPAQQVQQSGNLATAQGAAEWQARTGRMGHHGNPSRFPFEGVGFSSVSADAAISNCCFWGRRTPADIGVARGARGWFACVRYW